MSFKDKVVIVTGSSSGIGAAIAKEFAKAGANVTVVGRNQEKLYQVTKECENELNGTNAILTLIADVTKKEDAEAIIDKTIKRFGKLDILINNAGVVGSHTIKSKDTMEIFDKIMNLNLRACVYLTHLAVPHLIKTKGNIINISSILGKMCYEHNKIFSYCVSKAGLDMFTKCMGKELAGDGIRVNGISPGAVKTDIAINSGIIKSKEELDLMYEKTAERIPTKKIAKAKEVADLALFLASDKAISITAADFVIDNAELR